MPSFIVTILKPNKDPERPWEVEEVLSFDNIGDAGEEYARLSYVLPDRLITFVSVGW